MKDRTALVAVAAAMWGLDGLLRKPLSTALDPATVVLWEHLIVVLVILPMVPRAVRAFARCGRRDQIAIAAIGIGSSAVATALFTKAFQLAASSGDFIGPLVIQKLQPLFALSFAALVLRERVRPGFLFYALPALAGSWLLAFPNPLHIQLAALAVAGLSLGAAALWGVGTVLGRMVSPALSSRDLTTMRFVWGLAASIAIVSVQHDAWMPRASNLVGLSLLALVPGLLSLNLYYFALRTTAASRATFAELAFPATSAIVGVAFLGSSLSQSQWIGFAVVVGAITALSLREQTPDPVIVASVHAVTPERVGPSARPVGDPGR
ncbi:MAG: drug/metabolite transporter, family [Pseudonocardiales bacterium]|nr:drug/metabolite transporter, family [Pseudonocardiales bacterium]